MENRADQPGPQGQETYRAEHVLVWSFRPAINSQIQSPTLEILRVQEHLMARLVPPAGQLYERRRWPRAE